MTVSDISLIIGQLLPEPHAGLLSGILFGTKATMSRELYDALVQTGTLHIVALSGTNITILTSLVMIALLWCVSRRIASLLTILFIIGFIWFVGPSASVIRAAIMGCLSLLAVIFGRPVWAFRSWCIAVIFMLAYSPSWIADISFQLSALATLGMILFGGNIKKKNEIYKMTDEREKQHSSFLSRISPLLYEDLRLTLSAQVFTIPLILFHFHRISLISPLPNLLIGFILPPLTAIGLIIVLVSIVFLPLGQALAYITWVPLEYIIRVVMLTSRIPMASIGQ
jgi:competence protein ComEC